MLLPLSPQLIMHLGEQCRPEDTEQSVLQACYVMGMLQHRQSYINATRLLASGIHDRQWLTQVDNLSLSQLLPQEECDRPSKVKCQLKGVESQGPLLCFKTTLPPHQV